MNIIIDPEFQSLIRPLTDDEFRQLDCSILDDGLIDPLVVWAPEGILLDGHHRYRVCQKHGLAFETVELTFESRAAAQQWVINNQLGRRNLTPEQLAYHRGEEYRSAEKHQGARADLQFPSPSDTSGQSDTKLSIDLADRLGKEHDVSPRTIKRDAKFAESLELLTALFGDGFKADVLGGKSELTRADIVALAEMPREEVQAKAGDCAALREAAAVWRRASDEKPARKSLGTPELRGVIAEIERACGTPPNDNQQILTVFLSRA